ncbi:MAG: AAA family ATPase [Pyrinomonadaceae bacterium]
MATARVPILIWQDLGGSFTAMAITGQGEYFPPAAFNSKKERAVSEVREYLRWLFEEEYWREPPEYSEAKLMEFRVELRPEFEIKSKENRDNEKKRRRPPKKRTFTAPEAVPLRVACVYWKTENGDYYGCLPLFDLEFIFNRETELKNLVQLKVKEELRGKSPLGLSQYLPPKEFILEEITFQIRRKVKKAEIFKDIKNLEMVADPLGAKYFKRKITPAYERESVVEDLVRRLAGERASVIVLGESGIGKTTVLTEAVRRIERDLQNEKVEVEEWEEKNPPNRYWQTNGGRLIAGMMYLGQWQERLEEIIAELNNIEGVLCAENLLDLIRYGGSEPNESLAAFLIPYLQRGELRLVCEATPAELDACRRLLPAFVERFQVFRLPDFTAEEALSVLTKIADMQARNFQTEYSAGAIKLVYLLFSRFMPYQKFPGRTPRFLIDLFEKGGQKARPNEIGEEDVIKSFIGLTGLPELFLRDEITLEFEDVVNGFSGQVIGQPEACRQVAGVVTTFKAGLNDRNRPLGVLLFAGPTGVGKTELAKSLSRFFFGEAEERKEKIVRVDMSEYSTGGSAARLLTAPDGDPSELIRNVRENPFSVVLFDEVEKSDPQVFDVLLGLFDEGRLTDRFGRVTNFTSTVVIMTSNLGAERFARGDIGFGEQEVASNLKEIREFFRPEFFNRIDSVVQFRPLGRESLLRITEKEIRSMARREGLAEKNIELVCSPEVITYLARKGFDPRYGARPLQRTIETLLTAPLAKFLLADPSVENCTVSAVFSEGKEIGFVRD